MLACDRSPKHKLRLRPSGLWPAISGMTTARWTLMAGTWEKHRGTSPAMRGTANRTTGASRSGGLVVVVGVEQALVAFLRHCIWHGAAQLRHGFCHISLSWPRCWNQSDQANKTWNMLGTGLCSPRICRTATLIPKIHNHQPANTRHPGRQIAILCYLQVPSSGSLTSRYLDARLDDASFQWE